MVVPWIGWAGEPAVSNLKQYFLSRSGGKLTWSASPVRPGGIARREYEIAIHGVGGATNALVLLCSVSWVDLDRNGRRLPGNRAEPKVAKIPLNGLSASVEALEDAARAVDPRFFLGQPTPRRGADNSDLDAIQSRLQVLSTPEGRPQGEAAPTPASIARFREFWSAVPGLMVPDLFSSDKGLLRGRWNHGHDRTLWVNFPEKGPVGWSVSVPRDGNYGLRKVNAVCPEDQDVMPLVAMLGVSCYRREG